MPRRGCDKISSMGVRIRYFLPAVFALVAAVLLTERPLLARSREEPPKLSSVVVHAAGSGCKVDIDSGPTTETDAHGDLTLEGIEPGDHYVHVQCGSEVARSYFISPQPGAAAEVRNLPTDATQGESAPPGLGAAETRILLREHLQEAGRLRASGRMEEAIAHLREAYRLDPENSDLHREMGVTFLLAKEWKRARVEMLEAIRHHPDDAEAHSGLGYALEKTGDLKAALEEYRTASHLEPTDSSYRQHYLDALAKLSALQATKKQ